MQCYVNRSYIYIAMKMCVPTANSCILSYWPPLRQTWRLNDITSCRVVLFVESVWCFFRLICLSHDAKRGSLYFDYSKLYPKSVVWWANAEILGPLFTAIRFSPTRRLAYVTVWLGWCRLSLQCTSCTLSYFSATIRRFDVVSRLFWCYVSIEFCSSYRSASDLSVGCVLHSR